MHIKIHDREKDVMTDVELNSTEFIQILEAYMILTGGSSFYVELDPEDEESFMHKFEAMEDQAFECNNSDLGTLFKKIIDLGEGHGQ